MGTVARTFIATAILTLPATALAEVQNGSFEDGYKGWRVSKVCASGTFATVAIAEAGADIAMGAAVFDHVDGVAIENYSAGLPMTAAPTDGAREALLLQNGPSRIMLSQVVDVPAGGRLSFDLAYRNWGAHFSADQTLLVQLRDPDTDALLVTVFETVRLLEQPMRHHELDVSAHAGRNLRLQIELVAQHDFFDVELDNVAIWAPPRVDEPGEVPPLADERTDSLDAADPADPAASDELGGCSTTRGHTSGLAALAALALLARRRRTTR